MSKQSELCDKFLREYKDEWLKKNAFVARRIWAGGYKACSVELEASLKQAQERIEKLELEHCYYCDTKLELANTKEQLQKAKAEVIGKIRDWARNEPIGYRQYSTIDLLDFLKLIEEEGL